MTWVSKVTRHKFGVTHQYSPMPDKNQFCFIHLCNYLMSLYIIHRTTYDWTAFLFKYKEFSSHLFGVCVCVTSTAKLSIFQSSDMPNPKGLPSLYYSAGAAKLQPMGQIQCPPCSSGVNYFFRSTWDNREDPDYSPWGLHGELLLCRTASTRHAGVADPGNGSPERPWEL